MRYLKLGGASLNQTPLDWSGNKARISEAIWKARKAEVSVLCLPELCISGYGCEDAFHGEWVAEESLRVLETLIPESKGMVVAVGLPFIFERALYNVVALLADGNLAGFAAKKVLAGYGVYYEPRWFKPWPKGVLKTVAVGGVQVPIGDALFNLNGTGLAFEICEDAWSRDHGGEVAYGADIVLNPSASHFAMGKEETLKAIVTEGSRQNHGVYVYCNLVGNEAGRLIFDGSVMVASNGWMIAQGPRFSFNETTLTTAVLDLSINRLERRRLNYPATLETEEAPPPQEAPQVQVDFTLPEASTEARKNFNAQPEKLKDAFSPHEEFSRAVSLGLWDYLRKSRSQGFSLSLSGGVDSASVAVLVFTMASLALEELGPKGVAQAMPQIKSLTEKPVGESLDSLMQHMLVTVYQATSHSGEITRAAAAATAQAIGATHMEWDVEPLVQAYEGMVSGALNRTLSWESDDIARQNIQARVRSPGIWLLTNLEGRLLLTTSNRSEIGVGYATMDGDTSGGLAPIAGANKTFLRKWLAWMETTAFMPIPPLPALHGINVQTPTAELRPLSETEEPQTDEADLMPYPVLDAIEQAAIRDRLPPLEVWRTMLAREEMALSSEQTAEYVARFFQLWSMSQWKRERMAPSFHLDDENLDPKTWCRFPILSGGYKTELEQMWAAVKKEGGK